MPNDTPLQPRLIRQKDAPAYLAMSPPEFGKRVRPYVTTIVVDGVRCVWYDRLDLDAWADTFKAANGRPGLQQQEIEPWRNQPPDSKKGATSGILKRPSAGPKFTEALKQVT